MKKKLSVCIPTYNRAFFLKEAIDSVLMQVVNNQEYETKVEIVISDNASTDNTYDLVQKYIDNYPSISFIYFCQDINLGFDLNVKNVIEISSGEYCWLLGSDDRLSANSIKSIIPLLDGQVDIISTDRKKINMSGEVFQERDIFYLINGNSFFDFSNINELNRFFSSIITFGGYFTYMSNNIVKREAWNKYEIYDELIGTAWSYTYVFLQIVKNNGTLLYLPLPLVECRYGNDSFVLYEGFAKRRTFDLDYLKIFGKVFSEAKYGHLVKSVREFLAEKYFTLLRILSDKRSAYFSDGSDGVELLYISYKNAFSKVKFYNLKIFCFKIFNIQTLNLFKKIINFISNNDK